jgi:hypothetical protein
MAMAVLDTLLFGPGQPRWERSAGAAGRTTFGPSDAYRTNLGERDGGPNVNLSWLYLLRNTTTPSGRPLASCHESFAHVTACESIDQIDEQPGRRAWTFLMTLLRDECQSVPRRRIIEKLGQHQLETSELAAELWSKPALVPGCWINLRPMTTPDEVDDEQPRLTPFCVDFFVRARNRAHGADAPITAVIEIDQPYNFRDEEAIVTEIAKSRLLMRQGWRCFRFHSAEIERLSPQELYWETEGYGPPC